MKTMLIKHDEEKKDVEQLFEVYDGHVVVGYVARKATKWLYRQGAQMPTDLVTATYDCGNKDVAMAQLQASLDKKNGAAH